MILGLDPGTVQSAYCALAGGIPEETATVPNETMLDMLTGRLGAWLPASDILALEMVASYGMPVGKDVFDTVRWIGRFEQAWAHRGGIVTLVYRREVKLFHCETSKANDASIRAALLDRYGPGRALAIGTKAAPGPCYGIRKDEWSALAVALTAEGNPVAPALFCGPPAAQQQPDSKPF